jgi:hypothetical protein
MPNSLSAAELAKHPHQPYWHRRLQWKHKWQWRRVGAYFFFCKTSISFFSQRLFFKNPIETLFLDIKPTMSHRKLVIVPTYNELENISDMVRTVMELEGNFELLSH